MAIVGGPEWKCMVLDPGHDGRSAYLALYFQADIAGLLWPAAFTRESGERLSCSRFSDRALRFVSCRWIREYATKLRRRTRTLKFSKRCTASARRGSHRSNYRNHYRTLRQYSVRARPWAGISTLWTTAFAGARPRFSAATVAWGLGVR